MYPPPATPPPPPAPQRSENVSAKRIATAPAEIALKILVAIIGLLMIALWTDPFSWKLDPQDRASLAIGLTVAAAALLILELRKRQKKDESRDR